MQTLTQVNVLPKGFKSWLDWYGWLKNERPDMISDFHNGGKIVTEYMTQIDHSLYLGDNDTELIPMREVERIEIRPSYCFRKLFEEIAPLFNDISFHEVRGIFYNMMQDGRLPIDSAEAKFIERSTDIVFRLNPPKN